MSEAAIRAGSAFYETSAAAGEASARADGLAASAAAAAGAATAPLASLQALRDAVKGSAEEAETALGGATVAAEEFGDAVGKAGGASAAAAPEVAEAPEAAKSGWQLATEAVRDYADKAKETGQGIGDALVSGFRGAEDAVGEFVKTGKLGMRDLVTSILADLAKVSVRRFVLAPIANALGGVLGSLGPAFASVLHAGGIAGGVRAAAARPGARLRRRAAAARRWRRGPASGRGAGDPAARRAGAEPGRDPGLRAARVRRRRHRQHHDQRRRELPPLAHPGRERHRPGGRLRSQRNVTMAFHEVRFPDDISRGARGGPERRTQVVELASGDEERNASWADSRRRYDAAYGIRRADDLAAVIAFFEARNGRLHGFRWKDWGDYRSGLPSTPVTPIDQALGTGDGDDRRRSSW